MGKIKKRRQRKADRVHHEWNHVSNGLYSQIFERVGDTVKITFNLKSRAHVLFVLDEQTIGLIQSDLENLTTQVH